VRSLSLHFYRNKNLEVPLYAIIHSFGACKIHKTEETFWFGPPIKSLQKKFQINRNLQFFSRQKNSMNGKNQRQELVILVLLGCKNWSININDSKLWKNQASFKHPQFKYRKINNFTICILFSKMDQKRTTKQVVKISVLGNAYVGKTSLVKKFCTDEFDERHTPSTCGKFFNPQHNIVSLLGLDVEEKLIEIHGEKVNLKIWDSAGQERFTNYLSSSYFQRKQGVLLLYSVDDRKSFEKVQFWMSQVNEKALKDVIKILVASKCDSENAEVTTKEGAKLAEMYQIRFVETSSKEGVGVAKPFYLIARAQKSQANPTRQNALTFSEKRKVHLFSLKSAKRIDFL